MFEARKNYGITQWFDLAGDRQAKTDLLRNPTDYIPDHAQGAIFNQCLNPDDLIAHVASAGTLHRDCPRSIRIHQRGPKRAVIECGYSPMLGKANRALIFRTRYTITPDGRIHVRNTLTSRSDQRLTIWRNAILTLGDPTFQTRKAGDLKATLVATNQLRVAGATWKADEWVGYVATQDGYRTYDIEANTANTLTVKPHHPEKLPSTGKLAIESNPIVFGWRRCDSETQPVGYHRDPASFLYAHWDSDTPEPYRNWTRASILLVPKPGNPHQGYGGQLHGWRGCKRLYYEFGELNLKADEPITQEYLIQLGSSASGLLPDLSNVEECEKIAGSYRSPGNSCGE